jgi:hypothetical protein
MNTIRTLIESDIDYKHVKHVITHAMNLYDETPFYSDEEWEAQFPRIPRNKLHKIFRDMADDSELQREVDRDSVPIRCRWTIRNS